MPLLSTVLQPVSEIQAAMAELRDCNTVAAMQPACGMVVASI
jgi:hypothetical protein